MKRFELLQPGLDDSRPRAQKDVKRPLSEELWRLYNKFSSCFFWLTLEIMVVAAIYYGGLLPKSLEEDFQNFTYPLEIVNFGSLIQEIDNKFHNGLNTNYHSVSQALEHIGSQGDSMADLLPLDQFEYLGFSMEPRISCAAQWDLNAQGRQVRRKKLITVLMMVKSGVNNYDKREAIRQSWFENRTLGVFRFKTIFSLSACDEHNSVPSSLLEPRNDKWTPDDCKRATQEEARKYGDLLQTTAIDTYYNLTAKTVAALRWQSSNCEADFFLSLDDDFAFEVENLKKFLEHRAAEHLLQTGQLNAKANKFSQLERIESLRQLSQEQLYAGYAILNSSPVRSRSIKWFITYEQYRFNEYPPFITGGAVLMSRKSVRHFNLASYFVQSFKFDDVYLGIIAWKLGVKPLNEPNFMCFNYEYLTSDPERPEVKDCIGVHEVEAANLVKIWSRRGQSPTLSQADDNDSLHAGKQVSL